MSKGFAANYRIGLLAGGLLLGFGAVGVRLVWLHVIDRDSFLRSIAKARYQIIPEKARRGDIVDSRGNLLATSHSLIEIGVDPSSLRKPGDKLRDRDEKKWPQLAALLGVPLSTLEKIFTTKFREPAPTNPASAASPAAAPAGLVFNLVPPPPATGPAANKADALTTTPLAEELDAASTVKIDEGDDDDGSDASETKTGRREIKWAKIAEEVPESTYAAVEALNIKGVYGQRTFRRTYPHNELASQLLGFVNHRGDPVTGLERYADFYLRGQDGWREGERDGRANELAQFRTREVPRADGYSVMLTLDPNVQDIVEQELVAVARQYQPIKATIIVSDPRNGFILGLANYPTFDPNDYNKLPVDQMARLNNIATTDVYEPGSVFKIVAAAGALEEGLATPETVFDCSLDKIDYEGKIRSLPKEDHHFEDPRVVPLTQVISFSSNRGAAQLAMRLGDDRFYNYARAFGFGQMTGLPGGHEEPGIMHPPAKWDQLTITRMPMGQSVAVTAMQMHQAMSVIASGGALLRPQLIKQINDASGEPVYKFDRIELRRVISPRTAETMARLLMGVATKQGTAPEAAIAGYEVAGKTATAQKYEKVTLANGRVERVPSTKHHVASFIGFFPASRPQVAISVIIDDADAMCPGGVAYGAKVAAPVFKRLGEQLIPVLSIQGGRSNSSPAMFAMSGTSR